MENTRTAVICMHNHPHMALRIWFPKEVVGTCSEPSRSHSLTPSPSPHNLENQTLPYNCRMPCSNCLGLGHVKHGTPLLAYESDSSDVIKMVESFTWELVFNSFGAFWLKHSPGWQGDCVLATSSSLLKAYLVRNLFTPPVCEWARWFGNMVWLGQLGGPKGKKNWTILVKCYRIGKKKKTLVISRSFFFLSFTPDDFSLAR